ncbi:hypothetical protein, partial [Serratia marcescens]
FHDMLTLPQWKFISIIVLFYFVINLVFAAVYYLLGPSQMSGLPAGDQWKIFKELFYFSTQTFTTVG